MNFYYRVKLYATNQRGAGSSTSDERVQSKGWKYRTIFKTIPSKSSQMSEMKGSKEGVLGSAHNANLPPPCIFRLFMKRGLLRNV
jgi:hypothetical protein